MSNEIEMAWFAYNPLHNTFDRASSPERFLGIQRGITGEEEEFEYLPAFQAPYYASDVELEVFAEKAGCNPIWE